jgi:acyl-CoA synthetase (AMP-forming)/AMP-acid ligase II
LSRKPDHVDLSCLSRAILLAEVTDPAVVDRMREMCPAIGLSPESIAASYASSEAGPISQTKPGTPVRIDTVDLVELAGSARAAPAKPGLPAKRVVSCGPLKAGVEVRIGSLSAPLPERRLGEVWVRGPGVADGYLGIDAADSFQAGWVHTGDLGYMAGGELFITGRSDEVVVHLGKKYHPEDIERAVQDATGLPPGRCVAFSSLDGGQGDLIVVVEADPGSPGVAAIVKAAVANAMGLTPSRVVLVRAGTIPLTANGKLQRSRAREIFHVEEIRAPEPAAADRPAREK